MSIKLTQPQFTALSKTEQQGFGSYAIFGEQPDFYSAPSVWIEDGDTLRVIYIRATSIAPTITSGGSGFGGWDGEIYTPPTGWTTEEIPPSVSTNTILYAALVTLPATARALASTDYTAVFEIDGHDTTQDTGDIPSSVDDIRFIYINTASPTFTGGSWDGINFTQPTGWSLDASSLTGSDPNHKAAVAILGSGNDNDNITYSAAIGVDQKHVLTDKLCPTVFEFVSSAIVNESTQIIPERISPTAAAIKNQDGMVQVSGDFNMHLHVGGMLLFWKYILMDSNPRQVRAATTPIANALTVTGTLAAPPGNRQLSIITDLVTTTDPYPKRITLNFVPGTTDHVTCVTIKGTDQNDRVLEEVVPVSSSSSAIDVTTTNYFKTILPRGVSFNGSTTPTVRASLAGAGTDYNHQQRITFNNRDELLHGLTAEINKGDTPNVYTGLQVSSASLTYAENIDLTLSFMGYQGYLRQNLLGDSFALTGTPPAPTVDFTRIDTTGYDFKRLAEDTYKSWGSAVRVYNDDDCDDDATSPNNFIIPVTDVTFNINHNLEYPVRYWGQRFQRKPTRTAKREVTVDCTTDFTKEDDYGGYFFDNRVFDNADLLLVYTPYGGAYYETLIKLGRVQFTTYTDPEVSDQGPLLQTLNLKSLPSSSGRSDEVTVDITTPETLLDNRVVQGQSQLDLAPSARTYS